ncbi:MAG: AIPR family protein [Pseudonocardiaceae bacterium]
MTDTDLELFAQQLQQELLSEASVTGEERTIRDVFVERMVAELGEAGELEDGQACFHQARGEEISGYDVSTDGHTLDLFGAVLTQTAPPPTVGKTEVDTCLRRLRQFLDKIRRNGNAGLEEASPTFDMIHSIAQAWPDVTRVRFWVFTDGLTTVKQLTAPAVDGVPASAQVWDLRRLHRLVSSGRQQEPIHVDFEDRFGQLVPCLPTAYDEQGCHTLLAVVPGVVLKDVYAEYGARLLELNVRSFLQARGKVNQGIRATILNEPARFLAYNNGISATASEVTLVATPDGGTAISSLKDLQIVNGGQTTASLYHAAVKDKATLDGIQVQMKLTVVPHERLTEIVPLISRYANSQNKVQEADFSTNHSFHVRIEQLSRTVWAPAVDGSQKQTRWFYERARGQYQDALFRSGTPAWQRAFRETHPQAQKFTKTDLAKYELAWDQLPHLVSLGNQKCFSEFTIRLASRADQTVDLQYFHHLVAKAILFRHADKLVAATFRSHSVEGYKANVVAYTVALISERTRRRLDLDTIWRQQRLPRALREEIPELAVQIRKMFSRAPGNIGEWVKKPACWDKVRAMSWRLGPEVAAQLTTTRKDPTTIPHDIHTAELQAAPWSAMAAWAEANHELTALDRRHLSGMVTLVASGKTPTAKHADTMRRIYRAALARGFEPPDHPAV